MTLGSSMEPPSASGRGGIRIRDFTLGFRELHSASALELDSLAGLAGAGTTGDMIGITTELFTTTTPTSLIAASLSTVTTSITPADFMERADFMPAQREDSLAAS